MKISCLYVKAHLVFHWCLICNKNIFHIHLNSRSGTGKCLENALYKYVHFLNPRDFIRSYYSDDDDDDDDDDHYYY